MTHTPSVRKRAHLRRVARVFTMGWVLAAMLTVAPAGGQPAAPPTAAGRLLAAWLEAFNSADPVRIRAFDEAYRQDTPPPVERTLGFREMTGGFTLLRIEDSQPASLRALVGEKDGDTVAQVDLSVVSANGEPPKIGSLMVRAIPRPADLAIPRLTPQDALAALSARAQAAAARDRFSGTVLVARHGEVLLLEAAGAGDRASGTPVTAGTRFRLGSMNKMFTAVAVLQLVDAGKIALDDPIGRHLVDYPDRDVAGKVTIRHLLTHTGGTGDIFGPEFAKNRLTLREHRDYIALYGARPLVHEPGDMHRYSNYGYVLLGAIVKQVSGMSYDDYVERRIFAPAGMTATGSLPESAEVPGRAAGYTRRDGAWVSNADTLPWRGTAAGGGYSTAEDLFRFARALEAGRLVSKALLAEATTPQAQQYGFGFLVRDEGTLRSYGHGGGAPGMNGELRVFPELGYVLVSLSNLDPPAASRLVEFFALRMPADGS